MQTVIKLGKTYIWIDSLCIVQDNPNDVNVHCESMSQIYSNSFCTISATGAKDGTDGFFMPRDNVEMYPCVIEPVIAPKISDGESKPQLEMDVAESFYSSNWRDHDNDVDSKPDTRLPGIGSFNSSNWQDSDIDVDDIYDQSVFTVLPTFSRMDP
jgi:hypothetical protein